MKLGVAFFANMLTISVDVSVLSIFTFLNAFAAVDEVIITLTIITVFALCAHVRRGAGLAVISTICAKTSVVACVSLLTIWITFRTFIACNTILSININVKCGFDAPGTLAFCVAHRTILAARFANILHVIVLSLVGSSFT